jgi:hypothetical protein
MSSALRIAFRPIHLLRKIDRFLNLDDALLTLSAVDRTLNPARPHQPEKPLHNP